MVIKVQQCESIHRFFRVRAAIHKIFRRQTQIRFLSCFDPCLSAETRLMLHHKRALQTRIIKLCSRAAAILVYIFFTFLITFSFLFFLLLHFNLKRTTCFKLYTQLLSQVSAREHSNYVLHIEYCYQNICINRLSHRDACNYMNMIKTDFK